VKVGGVRGDPADPFNKRSVLSSAGSLSAKPLSLVSSPVILFQMFLYILSLGRLFAIDCMKVHLQSW
jgi:hypothetical protein